MSLNKLVDHLNEKFPEGLVEVTGAMVYDAVIEFKKTQDEQYQKLKSEGKVTFGKYKGYTVKELCRTMKGKEYCKWLLTQGWFNEKFTDLVEEMGKQGIKKN